MRTTIRPSVINKQLEAAMRRCRKYTEFQIKNIRKEQKTLDAMYTRLLQGRATTRDMDRIANFGIDRFSLAVANTHNRQIERMY